MKLKLLGLFLLAASPVLAGSHFFFGIGGGLPYYYGGPRYYARPPIVRYVAPPVYNYSPGYYGDSYYDNGSYGNSSYGNSNYGNSNYGNSDYGNSYYGNSYGNSEYGNSYGNSYGYDGYYGRPPYAGAIWTAPRFYRGRNYRGYWRHR